MIASSEEIAWHCRKLKDAGVKLVRFEVPDLMGISRGKTVPIDAFEHFAANGLNMYCGVLGLDTANHLVPGTGVGEELGYRDGLLFPDLATIKVLPWKPNTASVICHQVDTDSGREFAFGPRARLFALLEMAKGQGLNVTTGLEYEFYLLDGETRQPLLRESHHLETSYNHHHQCLDEILDHLVAMNLGVITHNIEYGPSQFEINFGPSEGIGGADKAFRQKVATKEIARRHGLIASFMSKPFAGLAGCGCHVHIGLVEAATGKNLFMVEGKPGVMSEIGQKFTAGVLKHAPALTSFLSPTPNCFRRLKPNTFAPSRIGWGNEDRTAMVRGILTGRTNTHIEVRAGSGMTNPYLGVAALLAAGLLGLQENYELPKPSEGLAEQSASNPLLPQSLPIALDALIADNAFTEMLGSEMVKLFATVKRHELSRYESHISDWELREYLEGF